MWRFLTGVSVVFLVTGCGSDGGGSTGSPLNAPTCAEDEYVIEGTLDGEVVNHRGNLTSHAWIQGGDPSTLDVGFEGGGDLHAEWPDVVARGDSTTITGAITLPPSGARGGQTVDAASGTMVPNDNIVQLELRGLSVAVTCITAPCPPESVQGSLSACVHWQSPF